AESTGKESRGLLPIVDEPFGPQSAYGDDRFFVHLRLRGVAPDPDERSMAAWRAPPALASILLDDPLDLAQEFFRWEFATATAGAVLGINPFDQPDVEESKHRARLLLEELRSKGGLLEPEPLLRDGPLCAFGGTAHAGSLRLLLRNFMAGARPGDYVA